MRRDHLGDVSIDGINIEMDVKEIF